MSKCTYTDCSDKGWTGCCCECSGFDSCKAQGKVCEFLKGNDIKNGEQSSCEYYEEDEDE